MKYKLNDNIDMQPLDDSLLVLDIERDVYYSLNGSARFFLECATSGQSREDIIHAAEKHFCGTDSETIARDFDALADELSELGIIAVSAES